jgi:multiple sugar transport system ATP-binding protein
MNLIPGRLLNANGGQQFQGPIGVDLGALGPIAGAGEAVTLGVRPENIELSRPGDVGAIPGRVELIEAVGADTFLSVGVAEGTTVMVRVSADTRVQEGDCLHLRFPPQRLLLFDGAGNRMALPGELA